MKRFRITPAAREDLQEIRDYLREESPRAAQQLLQRLQEAMQRLAEQPGIGHRREDLTDVPERFYSVYSYLIVYQPDSSPLEIIRVLHGARDVSSILGEEP